MSDKTNNVDTFYDFPIVLVRIDEETTEQKILVRPNEIITPEFVWIHDILFVISCEKRIRTLA